MINADRFDRKFDLADHASEAFERISRAIRGAQSPAHDINGRVQAMRQNFRGAFAEVDGREPDRIG